MKIRYFVMSTMLIFACNNHAGKKSHRKKPEPIRTLLSVTNSITKRKHTASDSHFERYAKKLHEKNLTALQLIDFAAEQKIEQTTRAVQKRFGLTEETLRNIDQKIYQLTDSDHQQNNSPIHYECREDLTDNIPTVHALLMQVSCNWPDNLKIYYGADKLNSLGTIRTVDNMGNACPAELHLPDNFLDQSHEEKIGDLCHEYVHIALNHALRLFLFITKAKENTLATQNDKQSPVNTFQAIKQLPEILKLNRTLECQADWLSFFYTTPNVLEKKMFIVAQNSDFQDDPAHPKMKNRAAWITKWAKLLRAEKKLLPEGTPDN